MKFRTTQKAIREGFPTIIKAGYCDLQTLLNYKSPIAYTTRAEGWGCDIYELAPGVALSTGYAPFGNVRADYELCREYEKRARAAINAGGDVCGACNALIKDFVADVRGK